MVLSRIHDCFAAEVARTSTTSRLLLEHLSGTQEAELPPTGAYHWSCCRQSQGAGILCCGGSRGISASPAESPLPEHKPTSPTAAATAEDFSKISLKLASPGLPWWRSGWESACQCRGHGFEPWSGKIPHGTEQLGPWATTAEPVRLEPVLHNERPRQWEARAPRWRVAPTCRN